MIVRSPGQDLPKIVEQTQSWTLTAPSSEEEWVELARGFAGWLRDRSQGVRSRLVTEPERLLESGQFRSAVLTGFAFLESSLRRQLSGIVVPDRLIGVRQLLDIARENEVISREEHEALLRASALRNDLAHTDRAVSRQEATVAVKSIATLLRRLPG